MENVRDLKIVGLDESRPPTIRKEPYIELYFKLNHQAPKDWILDFNNQMKDAAYPVKIKPDNGKVVETWVRNVDEITQFVEKIKTAVSHCSKVYIEKIEMRTRTSEAKKAGATVSEAQMHLNNVIANLKF